MYCNECGKYFEGVGDYCPRCAQKLGGGGYDVAERGLGLGITGDTGDVRATAKDRAVGVGQFIVGGLVIAYAVYRLVHLAGPIDPNWMSINSFAEAMAVVLTGLGVSERMVGGLAVYSIVFVGYLLVGLLLVLSGVGSITNASGLGLSKAANRTNLILFFYLLGSGIYNFVNLFITPVPGDGELLAVITIRIWLDLAAGIVFLILVGSYNIAKKRRAGAAAKLRAQTARQSEFSPAAPV